MYNAYTGWSGDDCNVNVTQCKKNHNCAEDGTIGCTEEAGCICKDDSAYGGW